MVSEHLQEHGPAARLLWLTGGDLVLVGGRLPGHLGVGVAARDDVPVADLKHLIDLEEALRVAGTPEAVKVAVLPE